ncbi:hypothetical protein L9W92_03870 [Pelotomaculum terephthalicicum JT]|uniref:hypothetical protein n=1 Tax=Pelotomaculum terephthalicicum TaxID=206393 RepID=UPI0009D19C47|nr:hypothetical protein [Pelotomaculum terephthalicicum]MCG9967192.1 hypothetical protein [Pelotomaculum terephthalicicum JT]OPX84579.1 MAG: hypothetical protein A4E54_02846 [Pelotomaculum sp. PtaB.Bin117]OPY59114.1 MAG: hypothetical protein A4E56_03299 [Pelotomaculum sp. PtaU1.Bin065]
MFRKIIANQDCLHLGYKVHVYQKYCFRSSEISINSFGNVTAVVMWLEYWKSLKRCSKAARFILYMQIFKDNWEIWLNK